MNAVPPIPAGYPRGPQFNSQHMMGGAPMMQQHSQGGAGAGAYMQNPNLPPHSQSYSPMPPHATPHMAHMQPYQSSPRPHMMQHSGSHQGFQQQGPPMYGGPSPGHHPQHAYHGMQQRTYSHGMPQMTPRGTQAMPAVMHQASPGGGTMMGDEGK